MCWSPTPVSRSQPARPRPAERITNFLSHHQGAHIVCFDTIDCHALDRRLRSAGIETSSVIPLRLDIDTPEGVRTARFKPIHKTVATELDQAEFKSRVTEGRGFIGVASPPAEFARLIADDMTCKERLIKYARIKPE